MWVWRQGTGVMSLDNGVAVGTGYSGSGLGTNNAAVDDHPNVGPIPRGLYTIGEPRDTETHGPFVLPLTPDPANQMHGRSGFLIHGDSVQHPGVASQGCIILARGIRQQLATATDKRLVVIA